MPPPVPLSLSLLSPPLRQPEIPSTAAARVERRNILLFMGDLFREM